MSTGLLLLIATGGLVVFGLALWLVPRAQVSRAARHLTTTERPMAEDEFRRTLAQILGGTLVVLGAGMAWFQHQQETITAREGQVTERFTDAIAHLGNQESLSVRLGGVYALERIARDSKQDHWPIMEILAAFIREKATARPDQSGEPAELPSDLQAALTAVGRRSLEHEAGFAEMDPAPWLDLSSLDLRGAFLLNADLRHVRLEGTILQKANLAHANLSGCNLKGAVLRDAMLYGADLSWVNLQDADLRGAILMMSTLRDASLQRANFTGATIGGADLTEAVLHGADLSGVRDLTQQALKSAIYNQRTLLPGHIPESHRTGAFEQGGSPPVAEDHSDEDAAGQK